MVMQKVHCLLIRWNDLCIFQNERPRVGGVINQQLVQSSGEIDNAPVTPPSFVGRVSPVRTPTRQPTKAPFRARQTGNPSKRPTDTPTVTAPTSPYTPAVPSFPWTPAVPSSPATPVSPSSNTLNN